MRLIGMFNELFLRSGPIAAAIANELVGEYNEMASEGMTNGKYLLPDVKCVTDACVWTIFTFDGVFLHFGNRSKAPLTATFAVRTHFRIDYGFGVRICVYRITRHYHVSFIDLLNGII